MSNTALTGAIYEGDRGPQLLRASVRRPRRSGDRGERARAALLTERLAQAGIHAVAQRAIGGSELGSSGSRYIYVRAADVERAKGLLNAEE